MKHQNFPNLSPGWLKDYSFLNSIFDLSESNEGFEEALAFNKSIDKKIFDYLITIPGIIFCIPIFLIIGLLIKLESRGPVFFKQKRVGKDGKVFLMYKFRSMYVDTDQSVHENHILAYKKGLLNPQEGYKLKNDPRITKVGKFLRDSSLDELPQLINILRGEMSLVGPRPVPIYEADLYDLWQSERVSTLPGITGMWQVCGRSAVSFEEQIRLDIHYVRNQSIWLNIKILLITFLAVFNKRGAG